MQGRGTALSGQPLAELHPSFALHFCLAAANVGVLELPRPTGSVLQDVFRETPRGEDGYLLPSAQPGVGVTFDREAAKQHPYQMTELPHLRREDGSLTNW